MTRWLVRFGYDGRDFWGWARQPGRRTIEGVILGGLARHGDGPPPQIEVASRTDRGVSAVGNALAVDSSLSGSSLLRQLNGFSPDVFFTALVPVSDGFKVRRAERRTYRYFEADPAANVRAWRQAARRFVGPVDVRSFGRGVPSEAPSFRLVERIEVEPLDGGLVIEVAAPSFVWGMVRKIIGSLREVDRGRLSPEELGAAIEGRKRLTVPMAEPEGLVLWEVEYPLAWETAWVGPNRHQSSFAAKARAGLWRRRHVLDTLCSSQPKGSAPGAA